MNKQKLHKRNRNLYFVLEYVTAFLPYVIWILIKRKEYFTSIDSTISMSIGCVACLVVGALALNNKVQFLKGIGGFIALTLISWLLAPLMDDLTIIGIIGGAGFIVSGVFRKLKVHEQKYCDAYITKEVNNE